MSKINIKDDLYFLKTTSELKQWANLMNVDYSNIPVNTSFKRKLYLRIKTHVKEFKEYKNG